MVNRLGIQKTKHETLCKRKEKKKKNRKIAAKESRILSNLASPASSFNNIVDAIRIQPKWLETSVGYHFERLSFVLKFR